MFTLFKSRPKLPASFERWKEVDIIAGSELLHEGPSVLDVRSFEGDGAFMDDFDRRQHEHYAGLFLQSGQWRAILLMLLEDVSEADRSRYLAEIDDFLAGLRERIMKR